MGLIFDEVEHKYLYDGIQFPSVTQIIGPLTGVDKIPSYILKPRALRGTKIHKYAERYLQGVLDFESLTDEYKRIINQLTMFLSKEGKDFDFESAFLEYPMAHKRLKYAGKGDIILDGQAIIDIKSSEFGAKAVPLQLTAYEKLWTADCGIKEKYKHYKLILDKDKYKFYLVDTKGAWSKFRFMLDHYWNVVEYNRCTNLWRK